MKLTRLLSLFCLVCLSSLIGCGGASPVPVTLQMSPREITVFRGVSAQPNPYGVFQITRSDGKPITDLTAAASGKCGYATTDYVKETGATVVYGFCAYYCVGETPVGITAYSGGMSVSGTLDCNVSP